jgi:hypothetical protein
VSRRAEKVEMTDKNKWLGDLAENPDARFSQVDFDKLTPPEQVFICIWGA